jgi:uncharacterized protein (DUF58 family)
VGPIFNLLYQLYRVTTTVRYWINRRFTSAGLALLVALSVVTPLSFDTDNNVTYQAFCLMVALLLFALGFGWWLRGRYLVERILPRYCTVGVSIHYSVRVRNLSRKVQRGLTFIETVADLWPSLPEWIGFQRAEERRLRRIPIWRRRMRNPFRLARATNAEVPPVPASQSMEVRVELTPLRRGLIRFEAATLGRADPLGLFRALKTQPLPQTMVALPKRYFIPPVALPGAMKYQQGGVALASSVGQSDEFVSLREYRRGDPYRHIHWRSWAKTGTPIVKEYEDEFFVRHALVLDTFCTDPYSAVFEEAVSVAASFACTIQTQESLLDLLFVGTEAYCMTAGRGLAHADQLLEVLASVQANLDTKHFSGLEEMVLNHLSRVSGCICVFLSWDAARQELVRKLRMLGTPLLVLVITEPGGARKIEAGPMREDPAQFHVLEVGALEEGLARL